MLKKKLMSSVLIAGLVLMPVTAPSMVCQNSSVSAAEKTQEEILESVIKSVKSKIEIPDSYEEFEYDYSQDTENTSYWYLYWTDLSKDCSINIQCDSKGRILSYRLWDSSSEIAAPKFRKSELKEVAEDFIENVSSEIVDELSYNGSSYHNLYNNTYEYTYEREVNGISLPENYVYVDVDAETKEVVSYRAVWDYGVSFPEETTTVTKNQAKEIIDSYIKMKLEYHKSTQEDSKDACVGKLVYTPSQTYIAVDAITGEVYQEKSENTDVSYGEYESATDSSSSSGGSGSSTVLSESEQEKVNELSKLLTKEEAVSIIQQNGDLYLDSKETTISGALYRNEDSNGEVNYVWNLRFKDATPYDDSTNDYYRPYASACVDATTGELLSFESEVPSYYNNNGSNLADNITYNELRCKKIMQNFLEGMVPEQYASSNLTQTTNGYVLNITEEGELYGSYSFLLTRMQEGYLCPEDTISCEIDAVSGKVIGYEVSWTDSIQYEDPENIISENSAYNSYMNQTGYQLTYELVEDDSGTRKARLVYSTMIDPCYLSAYTGKQVNYDGSEYTEQTDALYEYEDISNSVYLESIEILADMGIGFKGDTYKPEQAITADELHDLVEQLDCDSFSDSIDSLSGSYDVTRQKACQYMVELLQLGYLAKASTIFQVDFKDSSEIYNDYLGYVAIASYFGILNADDAGEFRPLDSLSRGEAAQMILSMIKIASLK